MPRGVFTTIDRALALPPGSRSLVPRPLLRSYGGARTRLAGSRGKSPRVAGGAHGLGENLAAFLVAIDALVREAAASGALPDETRVLYVSPLRALSNDVQKNLMLPLAGIREALTELGLPDIEIRTAVRTGDTPAKERTRATAKPPHLYVTSQTLNPVTSESDAACCSRYSP